MRNVVKVLYVSSLVLAIAVGTVGAYSYIGMNPLASKSSTGPAACSQPSGVVRTQLSRQPAFGQVTVFPLPPPLKAPNSIVAASDGSVWFGEVGLRGVAHLFTNGTLLEYSWPADAIDSQTNCFDISELWGLALWHGMVWSSDAANNRLLGLHPSNDTFLSVNVRTGTLPRYLAVDDSNNLWFTASSTSTLLGMLTSPGSPPRYFKVPTSGAEISASVLFYNRTLAYVPTVSPTDNAGEVFAFDPSVLPPVFRLVGSSMSLLGPYSVAVANGGVWASEHEASGVSLYNPSSSKWTFYPTSVNPDVALTLPYYLAGNGSSLWFNEQTGNRIAELSGTSLTEFNISSKSMIMHGIENALTIAIHRNLVWFTEWTGNAVGFVDASGVPSFSISSVGDGTLTLPRGSSAVVYLTVSGSTSDRLTLQYADSETPQAVPANLTMTSNVTSFSGLTGSSTVKLSVSARTDLSSGQYLVLVTVTDGVTYRSVYLPVDVT